MKNEAIKAEKAVKGTTKDITIKEEILKSDVVKENENELIVIRIDERDLGRWKTKMQDIGVQVENIKRAYSKFGLKPFGKEIFERLLRNSDAFIEAELTEMLLGQGVHSTLITGALQSLKGDLKNLESTVEEFKRIYDLRLDRTSSELYHSLAIDNIPFNGSQVEITENVLKEIADEYFSTKIDKSSMQLLDEFEAKANELNKLIVELNNSLNGFDLIDNEANFKGVFNIYNGILEVNKENLALLVNNRVPIG